jgi:predicted Fe-Mo cluster-binding NifX family protein
MKVAVTSLGSALRCRVDPTFGRARYLIVVDLDTGKFVSHDNSKNRSAVQGAGIQTARDVIDLGVEAVITGNIGRLAFDALEAGDVKLYVGARGAVKDAIEQFEGGRLPCAIAATVDERWM